MGNIDKKIVKEKIDRLNVRVGRQLDIATKYNNKEVQKFLEQTHKMLTVFLDNANIFLSPKNDFSSRLFVFPIQQNIFWFEVWKNFLSLNEGNEDYLVNIGAIVEDVRDLLDYLYNGDSE